MNTKIVYSVVSTTADIFLEQALCSIRSLRLTNKDCSVVLLIDDLTDSSLLGRRKEILDFIDEKIVVPIPNNYTQAQKSRFLKTSLRQHINGNFLFIDTDTIILSDLSAIDNLDNDIYAVPDKHMMINEHSDLSFIKQSAKRIGWRISKEDYYYFNSGVMFVKDTGIAHVFFEKWHEIWKSTTTNTFHPDQPSMNYVNKMMGYPISVLDGEWNCQISDNGLRYLDKAKIIHYFSSTIKYEIDDYLFYFMNPSIMKSIKNNGLNKKDLYYLLHPKEAFSFHSIILSGVSRNFYFDKFTQWLFAQYKKKSLIYRFINKLYQTISIIKTTISHG